MKFYIYILLFISCIILSGCNNLSTKGDNRDSKMIESSEIDQNNGQSEYEVVDEATLEVGLKDKHIIKIVKDITTDKDLTIEGDFVKTDTKVDGKKTQTGRVILIDKATLKAHKLTVKSKNTTIKNGIFEGDIYVCANGFIIDGCKIKGNVYFMEEQFKDSFKILNSSEVTGEIGVK